MAGNRRIWDLNGNSHFDPGERLFWYFFLKSSSNNTYSGYRRSSIKQKREEPKIIIPSHMSKQHYRRIKKYLWFCIAVDLALILFFMALPAGALIYAAISIAQDGTAAATIMVIIVIFTVYVFCSVSAPFFKEIDKYGKDMKLLKKNYRAAKEEEKINEDPFFMCHY